MQPASLFGEQPRQLQRSVSVPAVRRAPGRAVGGAGEDCGTASVKCAVVSRDILALHTHSPPTHRLTQSNFQSCELRPRSVPWTGAPFFSLTSCFYCSFPMFRDSLPTASQLPAVFSAVVCRAGLYPRGDRLDRTPWVGGELHHLYLWKCTPDVLPLTKLKFPGGAFLRMCPCP